MISPKFFPSILIVLMIASSIVYAFQGNWRMCVYWISGASITASVTY